MAADRDLLIGFGVIITPDVTMEMLSPLFFDSIVVSTLDRIGKKARDQKGARQLALGLVMSFTPPETDPSNASLWPYGFVLAKAWFQRHFGEDGRTFDCLQNVHNMAISAKGGGVLVITSSISDEPTIKKEILEALELRHALARLVVLDATQTDVIKIDRGGNRGQDGVRRPHEGGGGEDDEEKKPGKRSRHDM
jgi:hypothetical protein